LSKRSSGRRIDGILLLDKPIGMSSNHALQKAKRLLHARKAGHTGSLDPMASGLLPLCFGEATKVSSYLLDADKTYQATVRLGITTASGDREGEIIATAAVPPLKEKQVREVLLEFTGDIQQIPPMFSAIKRDGVPLYRLARQGIEVEREPRAVTIHELNLLRLSDDEIELFIRCTKGTYIRSLAVDIGDALGCGGYISDLRRLGSGPFSIDNAVSLEQLEQWVSENAVPENLLLPMESALNNWPNVTLTDDAAYYMRKGQPVFIPRVASEGWVRLSTEKGFFGIGQVLDDGRVAPRRIMGSQV